MLGSSTKPTTRKLLGWHRRIALVFGSPSQYASRARVTAYRQAASALGLVRDRRLVVTGCLAERYREQLQADIPEIDAVLGTGDVPEIVAAVSAGAGGASHVSLRCLHASAALDPAPLRVHQDR